MTMTPKLWSINGLAVELGMDRRTVALRLRRVRPDGDLNGHPAWHLTTALEAVRPMRRGGAAGGEELPACLRAIDRLPTDLERGFALAHVWQVYHAAPFAAWAVVEAGGSMALAYEASKLLPVMLASETAKAGREMGLEPWKSSDEPALYTADELREVDWPRLRLKAGEPSWVPPEYMRAWPELSAGEIEAATAATAARGVSEADAA